MCGGRLGQAMCPRILCAVEKCEKGREERRRGREGRRGDLQNDVNMRVGVTCLRVRNRRNRLSRFVNLSFVVVIVILIVVVGSGLGPKIWQK